MSPKELKYSKYTKTKKGKLKKLNFRSNDLRFGTVGLKAMKSGILNLKQIESARQAISKKIKKSGKIWIRIFPDLPITAKPKGIRMGKGKGQISHWGVRVSAGQILFEVYSPEYNVVYTAFKSGGAKLPVKTRIIREYTKAFLAQLDRATIF